MCSQTTFMINITGMPSNIPHKPHNQEKNIRAIFRWLDLENAGAWAVAAGFMHVVPYFGPIATAAATGMAAYMQSNSIYPTISIFNSNNHIMANTCETVFFNPFSDCTVKFAEFFTC